MASVGDKFGRLEIIEKLPGYNVMCKCICGTIKKVYFGNIKAGRTVSCGCRMRETCGQLSGLPTGTPTHHTWENMINRCNPKNIQHINSNLSYKNIDVCNEWRGQNGFRQFLSDMGIRPKGMTLDRIDGTKGYSKDNCRWADNKTQQRNMKVNVKFRCNGKKFESVSHFADDAGVRYMLAWHIINKARKGAVNGIYSTVIGEVPCILEFNENQAR